MYIKETELRRAKIKQALYMVENIGRSDYHNKLTEIFTKAPKKGYGKRDNCICNGSAPRTEFCAR